MTPWRYDLFVKSVKKAFSKPKSLLEFHIVETKRCTTLYTAQLHMESYGVEITFEEKTYLDDIDTLIKEMAHTATHLNMIHIQIKQIPKSK